MLKRGFVLFGLQVLCYVNRVYLNLLRKNLVEVWAPAAQDTLVGLHEGFRSIVQFQIGVVATCDDASKTAFQTIWRLHRKLSFVAHGNTASV